MSALYALIREGRVPVVIDGSGRVVAETDGGSDSRANAELFAASPELLAAHEEIERLLASSQPIDYKRDCFAALKIARAAIAKGKGESQ